MTTYNIDITSKAARIFTTRQLSQRLIESHLRANPTDNPSSIKVLTNLLHNKSGNELSVGSDGDMMNYRYIRVIVDIPAESKTEDEKQDLMQRTMACCIAYEGKKAEDCEFEIRINEVAEGNVRRAFAGDERLTNAGVFEMAKKSRSSRSDNHGSQYMPSHLHDGPYYNMDLEQWNCWGAYNNKFSIDTEDLFCIFCNLDCNAKLHYG
ncbi:hypothetical protein D0861_03570 [Hortaea werneckii]|uniref:Uncharacterized protein n=1 Tax=Hortaea werneckii TaxID=91943 RepID=A0A3M7FQH9_HORWE|nr:hypothetical protein D0861_03570 [Hortaea werneckii]